MFLNRVKLHNMLESKRSRNLIRFIFGITLFLILVYKIHFNQAKSEIVKESDGPISIVIGGDNIKHVYDSQTHPLIFIGNMYSLIKVSTILKNLVLFLNFLFVNLN